MELTLTIILTLILAAFICELIDSSLGMMYGTILSPVLIIAGFNPLIVVPSILFSQSISGLVASIFHQRFKNADFKIKSPRSIIKKLAELGYIESLRRGTTKDLRVALYISALGIIATIIAALIAINIPPRVLKTYIGLLVLGMGIIVLLKTNLRFSWKRISVIGIVSAFNKGLSGGGFGPVVTSGQVISGRNSKESIGATTFAEAPICIAGFLTYLFVKGIPDWSLLIFLTIGAVAAAPLGPFLTSKFKSEKKLKIVLGVLSVILGIWTLAKTWLL